MMPPGFRVNDPLWKYLLVLTAWWREIVVGAALFTVLVSGAAWAVRLILPTYETFADVTIVGATANRSLDDAPSVSGLNQRDRMAPRRAALAGLVHNTGVARKVIERLRGQLDEEEAREAVLLERIAAEIFMTRNVNRREGSDLIRITARADSPEKTAAIANAWAEEYVIHVNRLYEPARESLMASITEELKRAREDYHAAQSDLEAFMAGNNLDRLNRLIEAKNGILAQLTDLWRAGIDSRFSRLEIEQQASTLRELNERISAADGSEMSRFIAEVEDEVQALLAEREAKMAAHHALVEDRNIKRSALTTLQNESVELRFGISSAETPEVRLASPAAIPAAPSGTPLPVIVILAGMGGLAAAVCLAFLAAALNVRPLFEAPGTEPRADAAG